MGLFVFLFAVFYLSFAVDIAIDVSDAAGSNTFSPAGGATGIAAQVGDRLVFTFKATTHNVVVFTGTPPLSCTYPTKIRSCSWGDKTSCTMATANTETNAVGTTYTYTIAAGDVGQKIGFLCWPHCPSMAGFASVAGVAVSCENSASTCTPASPCTTCSCYSQWASCLKGLNCAESSTQYKSYLQTCRTSSLGCDDSFCAVTNNDAFTAGSGSLTFYSGNSCSGTGVDGAFSTCSQTWPAAGPWSSWTGAANTNTYYRYDCAKSRLNLVKNTAPSCATSGLSYSFGDNTPSVCHPILEGQLSVKVACYQMCPGFPAPTNVVRGDCPTTSVNSGFTCTPVCATGYTGAYTATCTMGNWDIRGTCTIVNAGDGTGKDVVDWIADQFNDGELLYVIGKTDHWPVNDQRYTFLRSPPGGVFIQISGGCDPDFSAEVCALDLAQALADWVNIDVIRFSWVVTQNNKRANQQLTVNYRVADGNNPDEFGGATFFGVMLLVQLFWAVGLML